MLCSCLFDFFEYYYGVIVNWFCVDSVFCILLRNRERESERDKVGESLREFNFKVSDDYVYGGLLCNCGDVQGFGVYKGFGEFFGSCWCGVGIVVVGC